MKFCSHCGAGVSVQIPPGDHLPRHICDRCGTVHYQNPKIVAGCIPEWRDRVLLCRRAIQPRHGYWTLPAGFMENGETTFEAAAREAREEANAVIDHLQLYGMFNLPHISQVYLMFRGVLRDGQADPGPESLEVGLFAEAAIPWDELAFPVVHETLSLYFKDRRTNRFPVHSGDIRRHPDRTLTVSYY